MRGSAAALAGKIFLAISRGTLTRANDATKMQTADIRLLHDEAIAAAERFQDYGFTSVPKPADGNGTAEVITIFVGGSRSHPIVIRVDDRRYRIKGLQPGESSQYDDQGQQVYISRSGIQILGGPSNLPITAKVGNTSFVIANGTITATDGAGSTAVLDGAGNITVSATGTLSFTAATIKLVASAILGGAGSTFHKLVTDAFETVFNSHTHSSSSAGPVPQMTAADLTSTFTAE
jgi:phage baseplate assembly protein V